ncbi:hypothetical protein H2200_009808 [Cladophialophora chaetospira]|uniref:DUF7708 domain-containing protein n=1 Tax=Cladophialophora chaetospira TaxID=386627 RepID=A0AA39CF72_9EURO|nr:hypothetical protein H2200_009808 [Cladophialophora chaetospira]
MQEWYKSPFNARTPYGNRDSFYRDNAPRTPIQQAFEDAKARFASDLTEDRRQDDALHLVSYVQDVLDVVNKSMEEYQSQRENSKVRKWLERLSRRIRFYDGVLDVLAQFHPEYTALVWGSIKFLIVALVNHGDHIAILAKALSHIADILPRVELKSMLYPTPRMKAAVTDLCGHILRFLIRARDWYEEGKRRHLLHSITRPAGLRYADLLEHITCSSELIDQLAGSGQLVEFREMHGKIDEVRTMVEKLGISMTLHSSAQVDTNQRLSDLQFSQIVASLAAVPIWDPFKAYQYHYSMRQRRIHSTAVRSIPDSFWQSPKLRRWCSTNESTLSIITGNFNARFIMRNLCVDVIQQLRDANVPVLLAMRVPQENDTPAQISSIDLLKYLVRQAIQISHKFQTEKSMALRCGTFHDASTETEWFQVLEGTLADMGGQVYIVIDLGILDSKFKPLDEFSLPTAFEHFFITLLARGLSTKVKVLLVSYSALPFRLSATDHSKFVTPAKAQLITARRRKAGKGAKSSQTLFRIKNLPGSPARKGPRNDLFTVKHVE